MLSGQVPCLRISLGPFVQCPRYTCTYGTYIWYTYMTVYVYIYVCIHYIYIPTHIYIDIILVLYIHMFIYNYILIHMIVYINTFKCVASPSSLFLKPPPGSTQSGQHETLGDLRWKICRLETPWCRVIRRQGVWGSSDRVTGFESEGWGNKNSR